MMPVFTTTGAKPFDCWLADGNPNFGWLTTSLVGLQEQLAPIRLMVGDLRFGQLHIDHRHGHWLDKLGLTASELVWTKLQLPAQIYEVTPLGRFVLSFRFTPDAVMVIEWRKKETCYSVVTIYRHPQRLAGHHMGRYKPVTPAHLATVSGGDEMKKADPGSAFEKGERRPQ